MRGHVSDIGKLAPSSTPSGHLLPGGEKKDVATSFYSFTQPPFFLPDSMQAVTKATPLTPSSTVG
jgi:hypothetical protein